MLVLRWRSRLALPYGPPVTAAGGAVITVESVERRERRLGRQRRHLAAFQHALEFFPPIDALRYIRGSLATWDSVRWVASMLITYPVRDVTVAWAIVYFVKSLPDGEERIRKATDEAVAEWEREAAS